MATVLSSDSDEVIAIQDPYLDIAAPQSSASKPGPARGRKKLLVLHLFSGPAGREDGLAAYLKAVGIDTEERDLVNVHLTEQDLLDDAVWERLKLRISNGEFAFKFSGPPCRTFSASRQHQPGPPVLRDGEHIYGFPKSQRRPELEASHYEQIRCDNLLAERVAEACLLMHEQGLGYAVEQPTPFNGAVTMFSFESFRVLLRRGARMVWFDQCMHDGLTKKPTGILYGNSNFESLEARCNHPDKLQRRDDGSTYWAPHPNYCGKKKPDGSYLTQDLAAYSGKLNCLLATLINASIRNPKVAVS